MRWLVTGAGGLLGTEVLASLARRGEREVGAPGRAGLDVTDAAGVAAAVAGHDVVVNCAAWTAVDAAETHEARAFAVNALGPANLARACARAGARLVHVSTDYVFAGDSAAPYPEDAPAAPRSAYGRTKAAGEWAVRSELPGEHWILRTAWLYGAPGPGFVRTMLAAARAGGAVDVVDDQHGQPTWARDVAERVVDVVLAGAPPGTYHATSSGSTTWYRLARAVFELAGADPERVRPTTSAALARPAPRPARSVLGHAAWERAGLPPLRDWRLALGEAVPVGAVPAGGPPRGSTAGRAAGRRGRRQRAPVT